METWDGCYDDSWNGWLVPEAFSHPAKASRALLRRIFRHLVETGALRKGDTVVDPFGGIGTTGLVGPSVGARVVCCELEEKFAALGSRNFEAHRAGWERMGWPLPVMVQGDSRRLREHVGPVLAQCVVSSPPYADALRESRPNRGPGASGERDDMSCFPNYGRTPGQLGSMPAGNVDVVVSSPPYQDVMKGGGGGGIDWSKGVNKSLARTGGPQRYGGQGNRDESYGNTSGQLSSMPAGDVDAVVSSDGQLGAMPAGAVDAVVSSPPHAAAGVDTKKHGIVGAAGGLRSRDNPSSNQEYGATKGQIGNTSGDTFWSAARDIVAECHALLKPGGTAVWIVKAYVKDKKLVDFPNDWRRLCEAVGFRTELEVRAMLVREEAVPDLFDGPQVRRRERKSFFRRLAERKGSPPIDYEVVWFMRKEV